ERQKAREQRRRRASGCNAGAYLQKKSAEAGVAGRCFFCHGFRETAKLFLISVSVFFPIYLNTFHGIRNVDAGLIEMGRTYGLSRWQLYWQIILPGAMSSILVGLRFSLGLMWVILIVAETISAQAGIGYLTMNAREFLQTDIVLVGILLYALLGKLADVFAKSLERYWLRWHPSYQD
ncbi:MAG: ABC transporter permease subunit, partial [Giesbergeria sp.]|uniref:ABC transporter permease subunit n=1 Tax=Giesbergeria sp. TaxID=2818473 RepID=UPI0026178581